MKKAVMNMTNWRDVFAQRLRQARRQNNLSQKELALKIGLSDKSISAYEQARVLPPTDLLPRFAKELKTTINFFFGDDTSISTIQRDLLQLQSQIHDLTQTLDNLVQQLDEHRKDTTTTDDS